MSSTFRGFPESRLTVGRVKWTHKEPCPFYRPERGRVPWVDSTGRAGTSVATGIGPVCGVGGHEVLGSS